MKIKSIRSLHPIFVLLVLASGPTHGQTKWIAHKSHSGDPATFQLDQKDNFGLIIPEWERKLYGATKIIKISDHELVHVSTEKVNGRFRKKKIEIRDTIYFENSDWYSKLPTAKEIEQMYPGVELEGFQSEQQENNLAPVALPGKSGGGQLLLLILSALMIVWGAIAYFKQSIRTKNTLLNT